MVGGLARHRVAVVSGDEAGGLTASQAEAWRERRAGELAAMTEDRAHALLVGYHAASEACVGSHALPEAERQARGRALDRARSALLEAGRAPWRGWVRT